MSWMGWTAIGVIAFNVLFFGILALVAYLEDRRHK